ncbi:MAG: hypothetical protein K8R02_01295 [Anaerohalosphaeraceae bacterium]|nr:hypothetical protein [Anaerohalosphaeraceae bacterium]
MSNVALNSGCLKCLCLLMVFVVICQADIYNGGFEIADPCQTQDFTTPDGWGCENYAAKVGHFLPQPQAGAGRNNPFDWKIDYTIGLFPFEGHSYLLVSTGPDPNETIPDPGMNVRTEAVQEITVSEGEMIQGMYFFGTCDYYGWNDTAEIMLWPTRDLTLTDIELVRISVLDVGDNSSTLGWQRFEYVFDANQAGAYDLAIAVWDVDDGSLHTYFAVDALSLCNVPVTNSDINLDCEVNFLDFTILADDWLEDCSVANYACDPNNNGCFIGTNLADSNFVNANDLGVFVQDWLEGF